VIDLKGSEERGKKEMHLQERELLIEDLEPGEARKSKRVELVDQIGVRKGLRGTGMILLQLKSLKKARLQLPPLKVKHLRLRVKLLSNLPEN
jgi:hypothetical protein